MRSLERDTVGVRTVLRYRVAPDDTLVLDRRWPLSIARPRLTTNSISSAHMFLVGRRASAAPSRRRTERVDCAARGRFEWRVCQRAVHMA